MTKADWCHQINGAAGDVFVFFVFAIAFQFELARWEQWGQVFKQNFVFAFFWIVTVDDVQFHQSEIALTVFGCAHAAFDGVAGVQIEAANLAGADVNVVRAGQIRSVWAAQEAKAIRQDFQSTFASEAFPFFHQGAHDGKNQILFAQAVSVLYAVLFGQSQ